MKTPIKIVVVSDFAGRSVIDGTVSVSPSSVSPGGIDDLIGKLSPEIALTAESKLQVNLLADFSPSGLRDKLGLAHSDHDSLTAVLHNPRFQSVEASWRGIHYLSEQLPEQGVILEILDASFEDVRQRVYDRIMKPEYEGKTAVPASLILLDYDFSHRGDSFDIFIDLAKMGEAIKAPVVGQIGVDFFGLKHLLHLPTLQNPLDRIMGAEHRKYHEFRDVETAFWAGLLINRFLLRAPYAGDDYKEPASARNPQEYLWGRGIWILGANVIQSFATKQHLVGISGLGTGGEQLNLPTRELPIGRTHSILTPLEAPLPTDIVESLPYLGISPLAQLPDEMGGQNQPHMVYLHLAANLHRIPDPDDKQFGLLTVHTSLAYSLMLGRVSNLAWKYLEQISAQEQHMSPTEIAGELKKDLLNDLWKKDDDEIQVTVEGDALHIEYNPYLVIHTRRFEISVDIPMT